MNKSQVNQQTPKDIELSKRRNLIKTIFTASVLGPYALTMATPLSANNLLPQNGNFAEEMLKFVKEANVPEILQAKSFKIVNGDLPWKDKLMFIKKGQQVTFLINGKWWISKEYNLWAEPGIAFNARIGNNTPYNLGRNTGTMTATTSGELSIARSVGEFANEKGDIVTPKEIYVQSEGFIEGVALLWEADALEGLYKLSANGDLCGAINSEIQRLQYTPPIPKGWKDLFFFNSRGIFFDNGKNKIRCISHKNVSILQKDVNIELTNDLKLDWSWNVETIPSPISEDNAGTHDYLSIAVKFDDGQDITFMWSKNLPKETVFRCPLPNWTNVETHVVQRSGEKELGVWLKESRDITNDYKNYIRGNAKKIVQIWFIVNTVFMRGTGICEYSNISIYDSDNKTVIL